MWTVRPRRQCLSDWEREEQRAKRERAVRMVERGASRDVVCREFGVSADVLGHWVRRSK